IVDAPESGRRGDDPRRPCVLLGSGLHIRRLLLLGVERHLMDDEGHGEGAPFFAASSRLMIAIISGGEDRRKSSSRSSSSSASAGSVSTGTDSSPSSADPPAVTRQRWLFRHLRMLGCPGSMVPDAPHTMHRGPAGLSEAAGVAAGG